LLRIILKSLFEEKGRFFLSIASVTFAFVLMLISIGIFNGALEQNSRFVEKNPSDIFVFPKEMNDFYHGFPAIKLTDIEKLENETGIKELVPMLAQRLSIDSNESKFYIYLASFDPNKSEGTPWIDGDKNLKDNEILISKLLARKLNKNVGDLIKINGIDKEWKIKDVVPRGSNFGNYYAWITFDQAVEINNRKDQVSFAYITVDDKSNTNEVLKNIKQQNPSLSFYSKEEVLDNSQKEILNSFLPTVEVLVFLSILIGTIFIGVSIYTFILNKIKEIGVVKAIGIADIQLYFVVLLQTACITLLGLASGIVIALFLGRCIDNTELVPVSIDGREILICVLLSVIMGFVASFWPVFKLKKIDPADIYKL